VNGQNLELEELMVSEGIGLPFHGFDFVVCPLERTSADPEVVVGQET
jgi:hypothetical protein